MIKDDVTATIRAQSATTDARSVPGYIVTRTIRRFTPEEFERLQGFPAGYTAIKGAQTPDGPRYKAMGNSMAVPVLVWMLRRIDNFFKLKINDKETI